MPATIRGSSSGPARGGTALLLSAAGDGQVVVGNAVDQSDAAVEVLLMLSVGDSDAADRHWQVEPRTAQCMLLGLGGLPGDTGADNMVVFGDAAEPAAETPRAAARELVPS